MQKAQANWLPDGRRLHLHHGPIDMIVGIEGPGRMDAFARAAARFETLLDELVSELPRLRRPKGKPLCGDVARRMEAATKVFKPAFITPMAAVAGAGADTVLKAITNGRGIAKAYVNNGGDVAFHITNSETMQAAIATSPPSSITIGAKDRCRGIATSGRGGRSHSLGIADAVTVMAKTAAVADAAATMIANKVDLPGHPSIQRKPANSLSCDSDLGDRLVTTDVGLLSTTEVSKALAAGSDYAKELVSRRIIDAAFLSLRGQWRTTGSYTLFNQKEPLHA